MNDRQAFFDDHIDKLVQLRRKLHTLAETAHHEEKTSDHIASFLKKTQPDEIARNIGGHGLIARYEGENPDDGPRVMIRCELDALPIPEDNDLDYLAENPDNGHKCGHDGHMAMVCGVALYLKEHRPEKGEILLLFQPAEETGEGALKMLDDDQFSDYEPDYIFGLHNLPGYDKHQIIVRDDVFASASKGFIVKFHGETSHAAHPEDGHSPALAMSHLIETLTAFPQLYTSLQFAAKVTVIHARLGEVAFGTSPGEAEVMATLRSHRNEDMKVLEHKALDISKGFAKTFDLKLETDWREAFDATVNHKDSNDIVRKVADALDLDKLEKDSPFAWSEDFGHFTSKYDGAFFGLGSGKQQPQLHASDYDFPDEIIPTGSRMFLGIVERLLGF